MGTAGRHSLAVRILAALLETDREAGGPGLSQDQVALRLGCHSATVSRALRRLMAGGEVAVQRAHAPGKKYRVLVYRLTPLGRAHAREAPATAPWPDPPEPAGTFVGRNDEIALLRRGIARGGTLVVDGVPGVGKTSLVRRAVRLTAASHAIAWTTIRSTTTPREAFDSLLVALGHDAARASAVAPSSGTLILPRSDPGTSAREVISRLSQSPSPVLWVLDDVQEASLATQTALREVLVEFVPGGRHASVLITQRELPWPLPQGAAAHLSLRGLSRKEAIALTGTLGLPEDRFEKVYRETLGNPRHLRLSSRSDHTEPSGFAESVLRSLPPHQRRALLPLALARTPVRAAGDLLPGLTPVEIEALVGQAVLDRSPEGLSLPEPLAQRLAEISPWDEGQFAHSILASSPIVPPAQRFVHAVEAGKGGLACQLLNRYRNDVLLAADRRVLSAAMHLCHTLPEGRRRGCVLLFMAEVERVWGDFVASSTFLERALEQLPRDDPAAVEAAIALSITSLRAGHLEQARQWTRALVRLAKGHRWAAPAAVARGNWLTYLGELDKGERLFEKAERLARRHRQSEVRLMALHGLCHIAVEHGKWELGLRRCEVAFEVARRLHRRDYLRILTIVRCRALSELGRRREALEGYRWVVEDAQTAGAPMHLTSGLIGVARELWHLGERDRAARTVREAVSVAESAQDRSIVAHAYGALAVMLHEQGKVEEARRMVRQARTLSQEAGPSPSVLAVERNWKHVWSSGRPAKSTARAAAGPRASPAETRRPRGRGPSAPPTDPRGETGRKGTAKGKGKAMGRARGSPGRSQPER